MKKLKVAITGAAGNLGNLLAQKAYLEKNIDLNLLIHNKDVASNLKEKANISVHKIDLANKDT